MGVEETGAADGLVLVRSADQIGGTVTEVVSEFPVEGSVARATPTYRRKLVYYLGPVR